MIDGLGEVTTAEEALGEALVAVGESAGGFADGSHLSDELLDLLVHGTELGGSGAGFLSEGGELAGDVLGGLGGVLLEADALFGDALLGLDAAQRHRVVPDEGLRHGCLGLDAGALDVKADGTGGALEGLDGVLLFGEFEVAFAGFGFFGEVGVVLLLAICELGGELVELGLGDLVLFEAVACGGEDLAALAFGDELFGFLIDGDADLLRVVELGRDATERIEGAGELDGLVVVFLEGDLGECGLGDGLEGGGGAGAREGFLEGAGTLHGGGDTADGLGVFSDGGGANVVEGGCGGCSEGGLSSRNARLGRVLPVEKDVAAVEGGGHPATTAGIPARGAGAAGDNGAFGDGDVDGATTGAAGVDGLFRGEGFP